VPSSQRRYFGDVVQRPDATAGAAGASPFGLSADGGSFGVNWVANAASAGG
jgi:hypothetical protein